MHEEFLKSLRFKKLDEFDDKTQGKIRGLLGMVNLVLTVPYVKIYEQLVTIATKDDEGKDDVLWTTRIVFAHFVLLDADDKKQDMYLDHFVVPVRPFKLRSQVEKDEMNQLTNLIWKDFEKVDEYFKVPDMFEQEVAKA